MRSPPPFCYSFVGDPFKVFGYTTDGNGDPVAGSKFLAYTFDSSAEGFPVCKFCIIPSVLLMLTVISIAACSTGGNGHHLYVVTSKHLDLFAGIESKLSAIVCAAGQNRVYQLDLTASFPITSLTATVRDSSRTWKQMCVSPANGEYAVIATSLLLMLSATCRLSLLH
jgi:hypothetical protein